MSKIICDVCGTAYPETATVCPICGCAKNTTTPTAADVADEGEVAAYNYVKGGRFSKRNVRKRNKGKDFSHTEEPEEGQEGTNRALIIVVVALLLAIAAVLVYIGVRFIFPGEDPKPSDPPAQTTTQPSTTVTTAPQDVPCTELKLSSTTIELPEAGTVWLLSAEAKPANTTDKITYKSSNENVVTVSETGTITAVGGGEAVITVTCGDVTAECKVKCSFDAITEPTTQPTEPPVEIPAGFVLTLKYNDITISERYPAPVSLYKKNDDVKATDITWTVDDPDVASVDENGLVSPVGKGYTVVHATIGDQTVDCKVHISFTPEQQSEAKYKISHTDVTLNIGKDDSFRLALTTLEGVNVDVTWVANEEGYVVIDGRNITAIKTTADLKNRHIIISTTYEGETYSCKVYIWETKTEE